MPSTEPVPVKLNDAARPGGRPASDAVTIAVGTHAYVTAGDGDREPPVCRCAAADAATQGLTLTTVVVRMDSVTAKPVADHDRDRFNELNDVRAAALEHYRLALQLSHRRRVLITALIDAGYSQADIGREMGVTRQAVQKMLAAG